MTAVVALLDANVLFPAALRDLLLQLAFAGLYRARWTVEIEDEWTRNLVAVRPGLAVRIARTRELMRRAIPDALVTGHEALIPDLTLPDANDRHVLAAAIAAPVDVIVTFNLRDFPVSALRPHGLVARHPDVFLRSLIAAMPSLVLMGVRECLLRLTHPAVSPPDYVAVMRRLKLTRTARFLEENEAHWAL